MNNRRPQSLFSTLRRLFKYFGNYKYILIVVMILVAYTSFANIFGSYMVGVVIDTAIKNKDHSELVRYVIILTSTYGAGVICDLLYTQLMSYLGQKVLYNLRKNLAEQVQNLPISYFDKHNHGQIMSYFTNDVDSLINALNDSFANIILCVCNIIGTIVILYLINVYLATIVLFFMCFISAFIYWNTKKTRKYFRAQQKEIANINSKVEEDILGMKVIKAFNHEDDSYNKFDEVNKAWLKASTSSFFHVQLNIPFNVSLSYIEFTICSILGIVFLIHGWIPGIGALTTYTVSVRQSVQPFNMFAMHINSILTALAGAERIFDFLDEPIESDNGKIVLEKVIDEGGNKKLYWIKDNEKIPYKGEIQFKNVTFSYNGKKIVLDNINFDAESGKKIAFVGSTGAGKTTIISLINRFYNIDHGEILLDGINIKDINLYSLRTNIAVVTQDTHLFTGTIGDNIRYSRRHSSKEEIIDAARLVNAHSFIQMLPDGYNTILQDDGHNLSEGQRQLIALARAALSMPQLLILDEATSNIDTRSEKLVQASMDKLMENRTVLVIAHRLSTIKNSDEILYLENGKILESGSNEELLKLKGKYYLLYNGKVELF